MRQSSNPAFSSLTKTVAREQRGGHGGGYGYDYGADPYGAGSYGVGSYGAGAPATQERPMTVDDVVAKTGITLAVIIAFAAVNFAITGFVSMGVGMILTFVGAIGAFITVLVGTFAKKYGSAAVTLIYAAFEGLALGGISFLFAGVSVGGSGGFGLIVQAIIGTLGVFIGMLFVYKTGAIKVTSKMTRFISAALIGVMVLMVINLLLGIFMGISPLRDGGPLAIVFSLICIGIAAFSFLLDFDQADQLVRAQAPASYAWGVALGLAVTLVWLYLEILRLLSYFNRD